MQKFTPFFWFNPNTEKAINFYFAVLKNLEIISLNGSCDRGRGTKDVLFSAAFHHKGLQFYVLNGGPFV